MGYDWRSNGIAQYGGELQRPCLDGLRHSIERTCDGRALNHHATEWLGIALFRHSDAANGQGKEDIMKYT